MRSIQAIIDAKFLSLCPAPDAVAWLKEKRQGVPTDTLLLTDDHTYEEEALAGRNDPYIDFGLARYGISEKACRAVFLRGDSDIKTTFLACFPNGGFARIFNQFALADMPPQTIDELRALMTNPLLSDELFRQCFEKTKLFEHLNEQEYQTVVIAAADNPRLMTPYDDSFLDGWSDYSYHSVFSAAWKLTETVPNTMRWASVLYHLLYRCQLPVNFDPTPVLPRWYFKPNKDGDGRDVGFFLRSRLGDILNADDVLLKSNDPALRVSFYKRFQPRQYPQWPKFASADGEYFLEAAVRNENLWVSADLRDALNQLCWAHPDPRSNMDMPNLYRGVEQRMRTQHPNIQSVHHVSVRYPSLRPHSI